MGGSDKCGSCGNCSCDSAAADPQAPAPSHGYPYPHRDGWRFFDEHTPEGPTPDATSLLERCPHYEYGGASRSQCKECIESWVLAVGAEEAHRMAAHMIEDKRLVAAKRIQQAISEHLHPDRCGPECRCA